MNEEKFDIPILFLTFNRLDFTKKSFATIKAVKPSKLYFASDGPRNKNEAKVVESIRSYVLDNINWDCSVSKIFRKDNLGCKNAVRGAIDYVFQNEEKGIIVEDDCIPNKSFYEFCRKILYKYDGYDKIMSVAGYNPLSVSNYLEDNSYLFSHYFNAWGWGTWRKQWYKADFDLKNFDSLKYEIYTNPIERYLRNRKYLSYKDGTDTWDIAWDLTHQLKNGLSVIPKNNLVENIGFDDFQSTHTKVSFWDKKFLLQEKKEIEFPLTHPRLIENNEIYNRKVIIKELKRLSFKKILKF